ncbi:MAG: sterol desaturase family protein [Bdellovibrionota bacterium]
MELKLSVLVLFAVYLTLTVAETYYPLRELKTSKSGRQLKNFSLFMISAIASRFLSFPLVLAAIHYSEVKQIGLIHLIDANKNLSFILSFLLLDYTLYLWHWANHKIPFLWRFHNVHHIDIDMDASTALRFHMGELILSNCIRAALALFIGFSLQSLLFFEIILTASILFHHSNTRLPQFVEKHLSRIIITPLYHQTHHSHYLEETNSNYGAIFILWDKLHKTFHKNIFDVTIGNPAYPKDVALWDLLKLPAHKPLKWPHTLIKRRKSANNPSTL